MADNSGAAFPSVTLNRFDKTLVAGHASGMTLRQWYAGMAMHGLLSGDTTGYTWETLAHTAFEIATAMVKEGEK